jgi:antitoxin HicB
MMKLDDYLKLPYTIRLRRDDEGDWIARVEELKGCTAHGSNRAEALDQLDEAKRDWIQAALEDHIEIPLPEPEEDLPSGKWVQRVSRSLHNELRRMAKAEGTSLNQLVAMILSAYVGSFRRALQTPVRVLFTYTTARTGPMAEFTVGGPSPIGIGSNTNVLVPYRTQWPVHEAMKNG